MAIAVAAGGSTTTIGSPVTASITSNAANTTSRVWVQSVDPADFGFAAPADGVLTRWTIGLYRVNAPGGKVTLEVVRPGGSAGVYAIVGTDERDAGAPTTDRQTLTFDTRIAIKAGDRLGVHTDGPVEAAADNAPPGEVLHGNSATAPTAGQTITISGLYGGTALRLSAGLEPDADGDGFGDVSQDACPAKAARQVAPCEDATTTATATPTPTTGTTTAAAPAATAPRCVVPRLKGLTRAGATKRLKAAGCKLGKVRLTKAARRATGQAKRRLVVVAAPKPGSVRAADKAVPVTLAPPKRR